MIPGGGDQEESEVLFGEKRGLDERQKESFSQNRLRMKCVTVSLERSASKII